MKSPASLATRPTSDRLRETLFNVLAGRISDSRFLDLCAGSGAVGIEALSRGAAHATFVDKSGPIHALIDHNLALCRVPPSQSVVITAEALEFLRRAAKKDAATWDIIFFDPPYEEDYENVLTVFGSVAGGLISESGLLIAEHHHKTVLPALFGNLERYRLLKQGDSALSFYQKRGS